MEGRGGCREGESGGAVDEARQLVPGVESPGPEWESGSAGTVKVQSDTSEAASRAERRAAGQKMREWGEREKSRGSESKKRVQGHLQPKEWRTKQPKPVEALESF